jgi:cell wall-associated NlpC family hydrolase
MPDLPPLPRILRLGSKGRDVSALQLALRAAKVRHERPNESRKFDKDTDAQVREFQRTHTLHVDGEVGKNTYAALGKFYDERGIKLLNAVDTTKPKTMKQNIAAAAHVGYVNRDQIHYTQGSQRMVGVSQEIHPPKFPHWADCSSFITWCYWAAGARDPNGRGYNGTGYSGTLLQHGTETKEARVGDIVFYGHGRSDINHVTVYVGNGRVVSHGQESGPQLFPIDYYRGSLGPRQLIRTYPT